MSRVAVIGAGAWGVALCIHLVRAGHSVALTARDPDRAGQRLPGFALPASVQVAARMPEDVEAVLVAVPTQGLRHALRSLRGGPPILLCCKGLETGTGLLPSEVAGELFPEREAAILTGPNFAAEIAAGLPAASVIAARDAGLRERLIRLLATPCFRLYGNDDPLGAQLGGAAKNVIAIAAGVVIGAGHGENARAALITRGLAELSRLIVAQGGRPETAAGLSGMGDLVLTCTGAGSRNFAYGLALGRGEARVSPSGPVVEGIATAPALIARATGVDLPICSAVARLLAGEVSVSDSVQLLLARPLRDE